MDRGREGSRKCEVGWGGLERDAERRQKKGPFADPLGCVRGGPTDCLNDLSELCAVRCAMCDVRSSIRAAVLCCAVALRGSILTPTVTR